MDRYKGTDAYKKSTATKAKLTNQSGAPGDLGWNQNGPNYQDMDEARRRGIYEWEGQNLQNQKPNANIYRPDFDQWSSQREGLYNRPEWRLNDMLAKGEITQDQFNRANVNNEALRGSEFLPENNGDVRTSTSKKQPFTDPYAEFKASGRKPGEPVPPGAGAPPPGGGFNAPPPGPSAPPPGGGAPPPGGGYQPTGNPQMDALAMPRDQRPQDFWDTFGTWGGNTNPGDPGYTPNLFKDNTGQWATFDKMQSGNTPAGMTTDWGTGVHPNAPSVERFKRYGGTDETAQRDYEIETNDALQKQLSAQHLERQGQQTNQAFAGNAESGKTQAHIDKLASQIAEFQARPQNKFTQQQVQTMKSQMANLQNQQAQYGGGAQPPPGGGGDPPPVPPGGGGGNPFPIQPPPGGIGNPFPTNPGGGGVPPPFGNPFGASAQGETPQGGGNVNYGQGFSQSAGDFAPGGQRFNSGYLGNRGQAPEPATAQPNYSQPAAAFQGFGQNAPAQARAEPVGGWGSPSGYVTPQRPSQGFDNGYLTGQAPGRGAAAHGGTQAPMQQLQSALGGGARGYSAANAPGNSLFGGGGIFNGMNPAMMSAIFGR